MKWYLLILGILIGIIGSDFANASGSDEILRRSTLTRPPNFVEATSFPMPFNETGNMNIPGNAAVSTGYYYVDSDDNIPTQAQGARLPWNPGTIFPQIVDTNIMAPLWVRILPGPRMVPRSFWDNNDNGMYFFRNPNEGNNIWTNPVDSTDNAIAGPIPIGIQGGFYFNGMRYDSFYVSTNGVIALTNRRYFYDDEGNRTIPPGATSCYDPNSMDWFVYTEGSLRDRQYRIDPATGGFLRDENGNRIRENGLTDPVRDDFGFRHSVLGHDPFNPQSPPTAAIMNNANNVGNINTIIPANRRTALIAVFWGDLILSQWDEEEESVNDYGKAYFRRSVEGDSLIISYHRIQLKGNGLATPAGNINIQPNIRSRVTDDNYLSANAHVILSGRDSSITVFYQGFFGITSTTWRGVQAWEVIRYNYAAGVRGFARHVNYGRPGGQPDETSETYPYAAEYSQHTHYFARYQDPNMLYPQAGTSVKYKQWRNVLRVADIQYRVRKLDAEASMAFTENVKSEDVGDFELLAGEERLGAIQPFALIQNLSNEIQGTGGVNFIPQGISFRGRFRIINQITGEIAYNRLVPIDALCMGLDDTEEERMRCNGDPNVRVRLASAVTKAGANYNPTIMSGEAYRGSGFDGVPPYYFVQVAFPPFQPNEFVKNHIGRHRAFIIAEARNARTGENLGGQWPFDDTASVRLFVMRRISPGEESVLGVKWPFEDDGTQFHIDRETQVAIPSAYKWVNIEAEIVDGEQVSHYPLPPRGVFAAENNPNRRVSSPTIKMNRLTIIGSNEPNPKFAMHHDASRNGDELRSFPIDMRGQFGSTLSLSVQRHQRAEDYPRGWSDDVLSAPEPRTINTGSNIQPFNVYTNAMAASNKWDELVVEFAKPSSDGLNEITNISLEHPTNWRHHPHRRGSKDAAITNMSALTIFGAGGYMIGFLENDPDSALSFPAAPQALGGIRANIFDDGIDWEFKKYFVPIPDTFIRWRNEGARNFRFRIKVAAHDGSYKNPMIPSLRDDDDVFFVDNVRISKPDEITDIELNSVKIRWPYTMVPASQATNIPVFVNISNNTRLDADAFVVKVRIHRLLEQGGLLIEEEEPIYCRVTNVNNLRGNSSLEVPMPSWNARRSQLDPVQNYRMYAMVVMTEKDMIPENDTNFTDVTIRISDVFAYDPPAAEPNNSVQQLVGPGGRGLNLFGSNNQGRAQAPQIHPQNDRAGASTVGGAQLGSGSIAMKFELLSTDTLRGVNMVFGSLNQSPDWILIRVLNSSGQVPGTDVIPGTEMMTRRGLNANGTMTFNNWVNYQFGAPVELKAGTYWVSVSQLGQDGLELAASASRAGARTTHFHQDPTGNWAISGTSLLLDKNLRVLSSQGNLENNNIFAYENHARSGGWVPFTPTTGRFAYPHFNHQGFNPATTDHTLTQGTWIPFIRPYFGAKAFGTHPDEYQWCPEDIPVELLSFDGSVRPASIDLFWETASETNNSGFIVQRKLYEDNDKEWSDIGYVQGRGTSNVINRYNFSDDEIVPHTTYQYRLTQMDFDGTQVCYTSNVVTLTYLGADDVVLEQNTPNPFKDVTVIKFTIPTETHVKLEILDVFGNSVAELINERMSAGPHSTVFSSVDNTGNQISSGTYLYRLTAGDKVLTGKMSLVR